MVLGRSKKKTAQDFVPIKEVRDSIIVLEKGGLRAVLMASSLNFALKSYDEQVATLAQFQNFLNSLDFPIQFLVQSRDLDIRPYIALLEGQYQKQTNDLMKIQTREYIEFIKNFTENVNIMTKTFYVIVPYTGAIIKKESGLTGIFGKNKNEEAEERTFEQERVQIEQRIAVVEQGLVRSGIRVVQLGNEELIELLYKTFNPGDLEKPISLNNK